MPVLWETPPWIKLHAGCGGIVRWREAVDTPGVGYFGACLRCGDRRIQREYIIPLYDDQRLENSSLRDRVEQMSMEDRAALRWDPEQALDENQQRLRREVIARAEP